MGGGEWRGLAWLSAPAREAERRRWAGRRRRRLGARSCSRTDHDRRAQASTGCAGPARWRDRRLDGGFAAVQRELRVEREEAGSRRSSGTSTAHRESGSRASARRPDAVVHRADEEPQRVHARHHDAGEGDERDRHLRLEDAEQDQELADEVPRAGHRQRREGDDQEERREDRRADRDAAHVADVLGAAGARGRAARR